MIGLLEEGLHGRVSAASPADGVRLSEQLREGSVRAMDEMYDTSASPGRPRRV
jgi:hypothetical protein